MLILTYVDYEKNLMFSFISSAVFLTRKSVIGMKTMYKFIKYYEHTLGNQLNATNARDFSSFQTISKSLHSTFLPSATVADRKWRIAELNRQKLCQIWRWSRREWSIILKAQDCTSKSAQHYWMAILNIALSDIDSYLFDTFTL